MKKLESKIFFIFLLTTQPIFAIEVSGNFKTYPIVRDLPNTSTNTFSWLNSTKIQLNHTINQKVTTELAYELTALTEKPLFHSSSLNTYRFKDLNLFVHDELPSTSYKTTLSQNLNRLNFNLKTQFGDASVGRMPLSFGVAKSISPIDVLTPIAFNSIDKEERLGVDALVFKIPYQQSILIDMGAVLGEDAKKENSALYIRPKITLEQLDLTFSFLNFKERKLLGFELTHPISDAGFWLEGSYLDQVTGFDNYIRATTGLDYKFKNSLYAAVEYHYNGAGDLTRTYPFDEFNFLRDSHYYILTASYELTPLIIISAQNYQNIKDTSCFLTPKAEYNVTENSYLSLGMYLGIGNKRTTEFGRYGQTYFSSFRYYF